MTGERRFPIGVSCSAGRRLFGDELPGSSSAGGSGGGSGATIVSSLLLLLARLVLVLVEVRVAVRGVESGGLDVRRAHDRLAVLGLGRLERLRLAVRAWP